MKRLILIVGAACLALAGCGEAGDSNITFGGAQDIGQFKKILSDGQIPSANTLDAGGFFAEHFIELPEADCGANLCAHGMMALDRAFLDDETWVHVLGVGFNSPLTLEDLPKPPVDLAVVIDTSGSMQTDDKMVYAIDGLHKLLDELRPEDRLAIFAYSAGVTEVYPLSYVDADNLGAFHDAVDTLEPAGATNLYAGLEAGFLSLLGAAEPDRARLVILLSDGRPSVGITGGAALTEMVWGYVLDGVSLSTVAVGADADPELMRSLAEVGGGNAYFLESVRAISEVFVDELAYFLSIIAFDVRIEIRIGEGYAPAQGFGWDYTYDNYLNTLNVTIPSVALASRGGDPEPGEGRRGGGSAFMVELIPAYDPPDDADLRQVAEIHLIFRPVGEEASVEQTVDVRSQYDPDELPDDGQPGWYTDAAMEKAFAVLAIYRGLVSACSAAGWNYHYAAWLLEALEAGTTAWNSDHDDEDIRADLVLIAQFLRNLEAKGADADEYEPYKAPASCATAHPVYSTVLTWALIGFAMLALVRRRQGA